MPRRGSTRAHSAAPDADVHWRFDDERDRFHDDTTATLAAWTQAVRRDDTPDSAVQALTWHHLDTAGCAVGALYAAPVKATLELAAETATERGASALTVDSLVSPELAVYANTAAVRYLDFNDNYFRMGGGHTSDIIPACWAAAELVGADSARLIEGMYVGYETHMALADQVNLRDRGWDYPAFISVAATTAVSKILGLTPDQTAHAIAMTDTSATTPLGVTRVGSLGNWKALASSHACAAGFTAARLAQRGVTGPSRTIEAHRGMWALVTGEFSMDRLGKPKDGYGGPERSAYKLHVSDFTTQIIGQEFIGLHREGLTPGDIESVHIRVPWVAWSECGGGQNDHDQKWDPQTRETADHSIPHVASVALLDGFVQTSSYTDDRFLDPALRPIMAKISVEADEEITEQWVEKPTNVLSVKLRNGQTREIRTDYPRGHHLNPPSKDDLLGKFHHQCHGVVPESRLDHLLDVLVTLDAQADLAPFFTDLRGIRTKLG
ncbi:MmgE/PrpD family protein [Pseudonocardia halophobica]|uniref:MmgE/PrpD family protein n=1 Tax=Pseudonocardia halophobica TaxID=29401 RepID=UPI003D8B6332